MDWRWDFTFETVLPRILPGLWVTVEVTFLSFVLSLALGLVLMIARRSRLRLLSIAAGEFICSPMACTNDSGCRSEADG